jgi:Tat protein translocase TatB subunit
MPFNIGLSELLLILVIALLVFGPRRLPEIGKSLGSAIASFRKASLDLKNTLDEEIKAENVKTIKESMDVPNVETIDSIYPPQTDRELPDDDGKKQPN